MKIRSMKQIRFLALTAPEVLSAAEHAKYLRFLRYRGMCDRRSPASRPAAKVRRPPIYSLHDSAFCAQARQTFQMHLLPKGIVVLSSPFGVIR